LFDMFYYRNLVFMLNSYNMKTTIPSTSWVK
jgi:hypothetical protein